MKDTGSEDLAWVDRAWAIDRVTDTPPEIAKMVRDRLMALSGEERMMMGVRSFEAAREMVLASLPPDLPPLELKRQLFQRIYGYPLPF